MKNAMKKIMSLVLVAMILVSAVPFQADAAMDPNGNFVVTYYEGGKPRGTVSIPVTNNTVNLNDAVDRIAQYGGYFVNGVEVKYDTNNYNFNFYAGDVELERGSQPANLDIKCVLTAKNIGSNVDSEPGVQENVVHTVKFRFPDGSVVTYNVEDGDSLRDALNIDLTKISSDKVVAPAGKVFGGWVNSFSGAPFLSGDEVHSNMMFEASFNDLPVVDNNTNNNTGSNNDSSSNNSGSSNSGSSNSGSSNSGSTNSGSSSSSNNGNSYNANTGNVTNNSTSYSKFAYPVYLNIYTDTTVGTVKKTINITNGIAADGRVTLSEVKNLVPNYYTADVDATGIIYDGLYPAQGNWVLDYVVDQKYDIIEGLYEAASNNYVYINVMLTNAVALNNTSTSTNPKTGDEIYMAVTGMALSACALAVVFYMTKKRSIV